MATLRVGCTGFSAGAVPLVCFRNREFFATNSGCTGFSAGAVPLVCFRNREFFATNRVAPVETGAVPLVSA